jgi:hypothetical protein
MEADRVNRLITNEVDKIEDTDVKQFIREVLSHERNNIDRENFEYKQKYKDLIKQYTGTDSS